MDYGGIFRIYKKEKEQDKWLIINCNLPNNKEHLVKSCLPRNLGG
jgi:hypothetical protein